ncbi:MAG: ATP-binding protein [Capsulimonadaceae bacterium]|nr:ATP-binding protein [Capsulimonadaceae bacterium]
MNNLNGISQIPPLSIDDDAQAAAKPTIGAVVRGSLQTGLQMKLGDNISVEAIRAGNFVVIEGENYEFFCMITDVTLDAASPAPLAKPPTGDDRSAITLRKILVGQTVYGTLALRPLLMRRKTPDAEFEPVKTIPVHFSPARVASADDVASIFGSEAAGDGHFNIGTPLDMTDIEVCLDLKKFAERSNGIFGKSGTGKTFLTRICLCGLIKHKAAVNLIFDMHNEYGWEGSVEDPTRSAVRGLTQYFGNDVLVFSLDRASSERRGRRPQNEVLISYEQITVEDIVLLADELNLNATAAETIYLLGNKFGAKWLSALIDLPPEDLKPLAEEIGAHAGALGALKRKLSRMVDSCKGFLRESLPKADDAVTEILGFLKRRKHVVLEFGQYRDPLQYMLVANILTRRIHEVYTREMEEAGNDRGKQPPPLVITIEEAHKFLSPALAKQTIFGTIAREMRKYNVTLLIVDQRPSGIDAEVLSQIGTRITCLLNDERDIDAVLTGVAGARDLRGVIASLDSKQQALLLGHATPMPVVIKTREYDSDEFRKSMGSLSASIGESPKKPEEFDDWSS